MDRPLTEHEQQIRQTGAGRGARLKASKVPGVLLSVIVVAGLIGLIAFGALPRLVQQQKLSKETHELVTQAPSVSVVVAQGAPGVEEFSLPGTTEPIQDAPIYARVNGYLRNRYANIGDIVKAGQLLADIDTPELDKQVQGAESSVEQAKAALDNSREAVSKAQADQITAAANVRKAKTDLQYYALEIERYKKLAGQGAVSMEDRDTRQQAYNGGISSLDAMQSAEKSAEAAANSAKAAVHVAQAAMDAAQAQHDQYNATRSFKKVTAPFAGIVTKRNVDAGALITSGSSSSTNTLLFEVAKTDVVRVFAYVPEQYIPYIHKGEEVFLRFQEYPGHDFTGTVSNVSGGVDPATKTLQVEIHVPNSDHKLLPGMYVQARFQAPSQVKLPIVPSTTLQTRPDGSFMYTVDGHHIVHVHKVEIGRDLGGQLEIAGGIKVGDKVIISPSDQIQDGKLVLPVLAPLAPPTVSATKAAK